MQEKVFAAVNYDVGKHAEISCVLLVWSQKATSRAGGCLYPRKHDTHSRYGTLTSPKLQSKMDSLITGRTPLAVVEVGSVMESTHHPLSIPPAGQREWHVPGIHPSPQIISLTVLDSAPPPICPASRSTIQQLGLMSLPLERRNRGHCHRYNSWHVVDMVVHLQNRGCNV